MKKKHVIILISCLIIVFTLGLAIFNNAPKNAVPLPVSAAKSDAVIADEPVFYTAHRGFSGIAPENTIPAIKKAGEAGYYACEIDVRATKDGVWVLMHDEKIDRMTAGRGRVSDYTYDELSKIYIDAGSGIEGYKNLEIPSLEQALDVLDEYDMRPMIEIKAGSEDELQALLDILETRKILDEVIIISFDFAILEQMHDLYEDFEIWYLVSDLDEGKTAEAFSLNATVAFNGAKKKNYKLVQGILDRGLSAAAWTIDDIPLHDTLYELGVRYITTNLITP